MLGLDIGEQLVELRRGDALFGGDGDAIDVVEDLEDALAREVRHGDRRHEVDLWHLALEIFLQLLKVLLAVLDEVPLGPDEDHRRARLEAVADDALVLLAHAFIRVDHDEDDVGAADGAQRPRHAEMLDRFSDAGLAAQARGVDEQVVLALPLKIDVDGVARGTRRGVDDIALFV